MSKTVEYCNWTFEDCLVPSRKWLVVRDCGDTIELSRGDSRNWKAYQGALKPTYVGDPPPAGSHCPNCGKYVNGVNPYDDGQTWRL